MNIAVRSRVIDSSTITPRMATVDDIPQLLEVIAQFFAASRWSECLTLDDRGARQYLRRAIETGYSPYVLALDGDRIVGFISYHAEKGVYTDPLAVLDEVFVLPSYRNSDIGRRLVWVAMGLARDSGAKVFHFPVASGMGVQRSLINMLKKFGAEEIGVILRVVLQAEDE